MRNHRDKAINNAHTSAVGELGEGQINQSYLRVGGLARSSGARAQHVEGKISGYSGNRDEDDADHHTGKAFFQGDGGWGMGRWGIRVKRGTRKQSYYYASLKL